MPNIKKFWWVAEVETHKRVGPPAALPSLLEFWTFTVMEATTNVGVSGHLNFAPVLIAGSNSSGTGGLFFSHAELDGDHPSLLCHWFTLSDPLHSGSPVLTNSFSPFVASLSFTFQSSGSIPPYI